MAGENGNSLRMLESAPETVDLTEPMALLMPSLRPSRMAFPDSVGVGSI